MTRHTIWQYFQRNQSMFQFLTYVELSRSMATILEMPHYVAYQKNVVYAFIKLSAASHSFIILYTMDGLSCPTIQATAEMNWWYWLELLTGQVSIGKEYWSMIGPMHVIIKNEGPRVFFKDGFLHTSFKPPFLSVKNNKILRINEMSWFSGMFINVGVRFMFRGAGPGGTHIWKWRGCADKTPKVGVFRGQIK